MKSDYEVFLETGILGGYRPEKAVLRKAEGGGIDMLYRDSHYTMRRAHAGTKIDRLKTMMQESVNSANRFNEEKSGNTI